MNDTTELNWKASKGELKISVPETLPNENVSVIVLEMNKSTDTI